MDPIEKRQLQNELTVMGLPGLDDPALVQAMADVVNGYPMMAERVDFFCELLNECEGGRRREMYEAMRPRLSFPVPALDECEARIAARAERKIRPRILPASKKADEPTEKFLHLTCGGCQRQATFAEWTVGGCMLEARKAGWGRGPVAGKEFCPECRLQAMNASIGSLYTRRGNALDT
jgi:hypothetical protein